MPEGYLDLLMASPTCTHHSVARGGKPTSDQQRSDPWHIVTWPASPPSWPTLRRSGKRNRNRLKARKDARAKDQRRIAALEADVAKFEQKIAAIRVCLQERRIGDALALTLPTKLTAPIAANTGENV